MERNKIYQGDALKVLKKLPAESIDCIITSPPYYGLRDYGVPGQLGLEKTLAKFLDKMLAITAECKRVLKKSGTMWWNHGDSYANRNPNTETNDFGKSAKLSKKTQRGASRMYAPDFPEKSLMLQAHRLVIRMIDDQQWVLRNQIIWHKPNVMPSSAGDRFTVDYEPIFFFSKSKRYWFEPQFEPFQPGSLGRADYSFGGVPGAAYPNEKREHPYSKEWVPNSLGKNKRTVWRITTQPFSEAHFATFPEELVATPIKAGCPEFVCKKCGKAREAVFEKTKINVRPHKLVSGTSRDSVDSANPFYQPAAFARSGEQFEYDVKRVGYSDCGCAAGWDKGIVLDPFLGSGTTARVAMDLGRDYLGIELNPEYIQIAKKRLAQRVL